jgi:hypothetical protein
MGAPPAEKASVPGSETTTGERRGTDVGAEGVVDAG